MFTQERQNQILAELQQAGRVEVAALAQRHGVSEHTIRRDLGVLEQRGHLQKAHGGAVALDTPHLDWIGRAGALPEAKDRIGQIAAALIMPGQTLFLDAGSTTLAFARRLTVRPVTVITNSLDIAAILEAEADVALIVTGGIWDRVSRSFHGTAARETVCRYRADWTILGTCALHQHAGATAIQESEAAMKREMAAAGLHTMVLADHSKRDIVVAHAVLTPAQIGTLVTDHPWPELEALGVRVLTNP